MKLIKCLQRVIACLMFPIGILLATHNLNEYKFFKQRAYNNKGQE